MSCIWDYLGLSRVLCWFMLIWPVTCLSEFSISLPPAWFHGSDDALELMLLPTPKPDLPVQKIRVSFFSSQVGWISFFPSSARTRRNLNIYIIIYIYIIFQNSLRSQAGTRWSRCMHLWQSLDAERNALTNWLGWCSCTGFWFFSFRQVRQAAEEAEKGNRWKSLVDTSWYIGTSQEQSQQSPEPTMFPGLIALDFEHILVSTNLIMSMIQWYTVHQSVLKNFKIELILARGHADISMCRRQRHRHTHACWWSRTRMSRAAARS
jgi:hypothetical protein